MSAPRKRPRSAALRRSKASAGRPPTEVTSLPPTNLGPLLPHHADHLRRTSGLTDDTIAKASLFSVTEGEAARALLRWTPGGAAPPVPALSFPYSAEIGAYVRLRQQQKRQR